MQTVGCNTKADNSLSPPNKSDGTRQPQFKNNDSNHHRLGDHHRLWDRWLPEFRFAINTAWHESTGYTPAEVALGRKLKGPLERALHRPPDPNNPAYPILDRQQNLISQVKKNVERAQDKQKLQSTPQTSSFSSRRCSLGVDSSSVQSR